MPARLLWPPPSPSSSSTNVIGQIVSTIGKNGACVPGFSGSSVKPYAGIVEEEGGKTYPCYPPTIPAREVTCSNAPGAHVGEEIM
jgi:hypothetical protein